MQVVGRVSRLAGREEGGASRVHFHLAVLRRPEEPQLVPENRPADCRRDLDEVLERVGRPQARRSQFGREVVLLPAIERPAHEKIAGEPVAAVTRNHVDADATARRVGAHRAGLVGHVLNHREVVVARLADAVRNPDVDAVDFDRVVVRASPARAQIRRLAHLNAAHVGPRDLGGRHDHAGREKRAGGGEGVELLAAEHLPLRGLLHVHHRGRPRHSDGFRDRPHSQLRIDRNRDVCRDLDPFAGDRGEPLEGECDRINPRPNVDDGVTTLIVSRGRPGSFQSARDSTLRR